MSEEKPPTRTEAEPEPKPDVDAEEEAKATKATPDKELEPAPTPPRSDIVDTFDINEGRTADELQVFTESSLGLRPENVDQNIGRHWYETQSWNVKHSSEALAFRKAHSLGTYVHSDSYFGAEYDRAGLVKQRGTPRQGFPKPHHFGRLNRYVPLSVEGRIIAAVGESYHQGKLIKVGYAAALGVAAYASHYMSIVESVDLPEEFQQYDNGTGVSCATRFYLPDFKLLDVAAAEGDGYIKKYTASAFSCWGYYLNRKYASLENVKYQARAYHLHFRRRIEVGELMCDSRIVEKTRTSTTLKSELWGTLSHCRAELDDGGRLLLQISTILPDDHWSQSMNGNPFGDYLLAPAYKQISCLWTRAWMTSSANFFLRNHCSEVYVKPLETAQAGSYFDVLA